MKPSNSVFSSLGTTVFEVMSRLAMEHGSINLGQGCDQVFDLPLSVFKLERDRMVGHQQRSLA